MIFIGELDANVDADANVNAEANVNADRNMNMNANPNVNANPGNIPQPNAQRGGFNFGNFFNGFNFLGLNMLRNFWNERVLSENMKNKKHKDKGDSTIEAIKKMANKTNSPELNLILGNMYLTGDSKHSILPNLEKALEFYEKAAETGSLEAQLYLGHYHSNTNTLKALKYFDKCADGGLAQCRIAIGDIYLGKSTYLTS